MNQSEKSDMVISIEMNQSENSNSVISTEITPPKTQHQIKKDNKKPFSFEEGLILLFISKTYLPIYTNKIEISAGETPLIREAWESVVGRIFFSFSRLSKDKDKSLS